MLDALQGMMRMADRGLTAHITFADGERRTNVTILAADTAGIAAEGRDPEVQAVLIPWSAIRIIHVLQPE